jgi:hypothetical protein
MAIGVSIALRYVNASFTLLNRPPRLPFFFGSESLVLVSDGVELLAVVDVDVLASLPSAFFVDDGFVVVDDDDDDDESLGADDDPLPSPNGLSSPNSRAILVNSSRCLSFSFLLLQ